MKNGYAPPPEPKRPPKKLFEAMGRIFRLSRPYRGRLIAALALTLVSAGVWLLLPLGMRTMVDAVFEQADRVLLNRMTLGLMAFFVVQSAIGFVGFYLLEWTGERLVTDLRKQLYAHLLNLDLRFFSNQRTGDLTSRLTNDVGTIRTAVTSSFVDAVRQTMMLIGSAVLMVVLDWQMSLFIFMTVPPVMLLARFFGARIRALARDVQDRLADSTAVAEESISAVRVVKAFAREPYEVDRFNGSVDVLFKTAIRKVVITNVFWSTVGLLFMLALIGLFWYGGVSVLNGRLTSGGLVAFVFYAFNIARTVGGMSQLYTTFNNAAGASERLFELMDTTPETTDSQDARPLPAVRGEVHFSNVGFGYREGHPVLESIDRVIHPGEKVALVGPSGAGKTTLLNLIPRFYDPDAGQVLVDGYNLRDVTLASLRAQIAVVSQDVHLFNASVRENIRYGRLEADQASIEAAAEAANAHAFIVGLPEGYDTVVGERGTKLSGGQKQRIAIARAILRDARILLLDEATSSLDSTSEALVQEALDHLMKGRTTFIIAHRLSTVQDADRILVLDQGRIVQEGTHEALFAQEGMYRELASRQFRDTLAPVAPAGA
jgi:ATP-binding cassette, subfamily B, bacterial MsbA